MENKQIIKLLKGNLAGQEYTRDIVVNFSQNKNNALLANLWARKQIDLCGLCRAYA